MINKNALEIMSVAASPAASPPPISADSNMLYLDSGLEA